MGQTAIASASMPRSRRSRRRLTTLRCIGSAHTIPTGRKISRMPRVTFYPVGNGDTSQIVLNNGKRLIFDYHHQKKSEEEGSTDFNLKKHLTDELSGAARRGRCAGADAWR